MLGHALCNALAEYDLVPADLPDYDLTKFEDLQAKINDIKPDFVINAAAFTDVDGCEASEEICDLVNGQAVGNLAQACKKIGCILVHYSTDYVFNDENSQGYLENDQINPLNAYGKSKALGEELILKSGCDFYLIRTAWLYGANGKNFVDTILDLATKQEEIKVVNDQVGNPTYALDLAQSTKKILVDKPSFGIYHQTNAGSCSWYEFALKIKELTGFKAAILPVTSAEFIRPAKRPKFSILLNTKLPLLRPWENSLKDYLK